MSPEDAARWPSFCEFVAGVSGFLEAVYSTRPPRVQSRSAGDLFALATLGRRLRGMGRRGMMQLLRAVPMPIADLAEEWFRHESVRALLAVQGTIDVLQGPMSGGTALVFLHHAVGQSPGSIGVRRAVRGGSGALVAALATAARSHGAEIRFGAEVASVLVRDGRAGGVVLATGEEIGARNVLSSADPRRSFGWVDPRWLDPALLHAVDQVRSSGAAARVHFALDGLPRFVAGGREVPRDVLGGTMALVTSVAGIERAYDDAKYGTLPATPALTVTVPSLIDPSLAPERRHVLSVTVHQVPGALRGGWTPAATDDLADRVTAMVATIAPDLRERTLQRWVLTPADLEARYACTGGSLTHGELALDQFLFMRPVPACARYATPLEGFWLGGTGSHPGLASGAAGRLAARELLARR
jgi:phytoene dehydrogenase-like protein